MIELYKYEDADLDKMKFNRYAWHLKNRKAIKQIKEYLKRANSFTLYDVKKEKPIAILAFHFYYSGLAYGMIIADEILADNPKYAILIKKIANRLMTDYHIEYLQTVSEDVPALNKWHEFLGFHKEKSLPQHLRGRDFILWSR